MPAVRILKSVWGRIVEEAFMAFTLYLKMARNARQNDEADVFLLVMPREAGGNLLRYDCLERLMNVWVYHPRQRTVSFPDGQL
jgi:hypothetical protein